MNPDDYIKVGLQLERVFEVGDFDTAVHVGSGSLKVLATPRMIAFIEITARDMLEEVLPEGFSSVGVRVDIRHLAPSPVGSQIRVRCDVVGVEGSKVNFSVEAWDGTEQVGAGRHQRVIIDVERFLRRVEAKA